MAKKVLIIDDSVTQLSSLKIFFKRAGWNVETASNGVEGFMMVYRCAPDVIISDVLMPHLGGFQLCRLLKSNPETSKIPVIVLTVLDKKLDKYWANHSGADKFIQKDSDFSEIIKAAQEISDSNHLSIKYKEALKGTDFSEESIITQINKILDNALMKATITNEFRSIVDYTADDKIIADKIFKILSTIIEYEAAVIYFCSPDPAQKKRLIFNTQNVELANNVYGEVWENILPDYLEDFSPEILSPSNSDIVIKNLSEFKSSTVLDFYYDKEHIGKVCFYSTNVTDWDKMKFMHTAKSELDLFLRLKFLYAKTRYLSIIDDLTKLYTRRHMDSVLKQEYERAKRYGSLLSAAMADIDDFKQINDTYGHQAGDLILSSISKIFTKGLRKTDHIFRYGGEEIYILMPETNIENVIIPLERIRKTIENTVFNYGEHKISVTVSVGAATYSKDMTDSFDLIEKADIALYKAKKTGKNKVAIENE